MNPLIHHPKSGLGPKRTADSSPISTAPLPGPLRIKSCRSVGTRCSFIPWGTPNGVKVTVMLEELLALGHHGCGVRRLADQDRCGRPVQFRFRGDQPQLQDSRVARPQRPEAHSGLRVRLSYWCTWPRNSALSYRSTLRSARNACRGCSGKWAARPISVAGSATFTRMPPPRSNTPSIGSPWK